MAQTDPDIPEYESGVEKAKTMINEMLTEVVHKIDSTHMECKKGFDDKCQIMEFLRADMDELNAQNAESNTNAIKYQGEISIQEQEIPRLQELLENNRKTCSRKLHQLNQLKGTVESDIEVIEGVLNMTDCSKAAFIQRSHTTILKCSACGHSANNTSFYRFQSTALHQKISSIKSQGIQERVLAALESMATSGDKLQKKTNPKTIPEPVKVEIPPDPCAGASYDKRPVGEQGGCSIATNPNCRNLQEKFMDIQMNSLTDRPVVSVSKTTSLIYIR
jgi:ribosomal protein L37AE/L43A